MDLVLSLWRLCVLEAVLNVMYVEHTLIPDWENGLRTPVLVPSSEKSGHLL